MKTLTPRISGLPPHRTTINIIEHIHPFFVVFAKVISINSYIGNPSMNEEKTRECYQRIVYFNIFFIDFRFGVESV